MILTRVALLFSFWLCTCVPAQLYPQFSFRNEALELVAELPEELEEISGLSYLNGSLWAVEDELGILYRMDPKSGEILERIPFWKDGDYEGVAAVSNREVWVTKSNGRLYRVTQPGKKDQEVKEYNTWMDGDNDVEGLAYDQAGNRLLLACKDDPRGDGRAKENRYIFAFDLDEGVVDEDAAYSLPREDEFSPSALALYPGSGQLVLTSSVGERLLIASAKGEIESVVKLDKDLLPQPEGLAFGPNGTLFISTEAGNGKRARIYRLPLRP